MYCIETHCDISDSINTFGVRSAVCGSWVAKIDLPRRSTFTTVVQTNWVPPFFFFFFCTRASSAHNNTLYDVARREWAERNVYENLLRQKGCCCSVVLTATGPRRRTRVANAIKRSRVESRPTTPKSVNEKNVTRLENPAPDRRIRGKYLPVYRYFGTVFTTSFE